MVREQRGIDSSDRNRNICKEFLVVTYCPMNGFPGVSEQTGDVAFVGSSQGPRLSPHYLYGIPFVPMKRCELEKTERRVSAVVVRLHEENMQAYPGSAPFELIGPPYKDLLWERRNEKHPQLQTHEPPCCDMI